MALLNANLFFRGNRKYGMGNINFDLILTENHERSNIVTAHSIEDGSQISDHIQNELERGSLTGLISNFSIKVRGSFSNRSQDAFDAMDNLWKSRTLVTIRTVLKVYENVAITGLTVARSEGTGEATVINASFQKVKKVKLQELQGVVNQGSMDNDTARQSASPSNNGRTVGVPQ